MHHIPSPPIPSPLPLSLAHLHSPVCVCSMVGIHNHLLISRMSCETRYSCCSAADLANFSASCGGSRSPTTQFSFCSLAMSLVSAWGAWGAGAVGFFIWIQFYQDTTITLLAGFFNKINNSLHQTSLLLPQLQLLRFRLQVHEAHHPARGEDGLHSREGGPADHCLQGAVVFAAVDGPQFEVFDFFDCGVVLELLFDFGEERGVLAAVEQQEGGFLGDGDGGVDGHDGEEVGAEGVGQLHVAPAGRREEVDDEGGEDDADRQDDVREDVRVGGLHVDVLELLLLLVFVLHFLVRRYARHAEVFPLVDGGVGVVVDCLLANDQIVQTVVVFVFLMLVAAFPVPMIVVVVVIVVFVLFVFMFMFIRVVVVMVVVVVVVVGVVVVAVTAGGAVFMGRFMFMFMFMFMGTLFSVYVGTFFSFYGFGPVVVGAVVVSGVGVGVEYAHDVEVAEQAEEGGAEHVGGFFHHCLVVHADGSFDEEFGGDDPDDGHVEEGAEGLQFVVAEGEVGRACLGAHVDGVERDDVGEHVGEQVEGVGHDGDGVGHVAAHDLQHHEAQGNGSDLLQLPDHVLILPAHRNYKPSPRRTTTSWALKSNFFQLGPHSIKLPFPSQRFPFPSLQSSENLRIDGSISFPLSPLDFSLQSTLDKRRSGGFAQWDYTPYPQ